MINDKVRAVILGFSSPICLHSTSSVGSQTRPHGRRGGRGGGCNPLTWPDMTTATHEYSATLSHNLRTCLLWWYYIYIMAQLLSPAKFHHLLMIITHSLLIPRQFSKLLNRIIPITQGRAVVCSFEGCNFVLCFPLSLGYNQRFPPIKHNWNKFASTPSVVASQ